MMHREIMNKEDSIMGSYSFSEYETTYEKIEIEEYGPHFTERNSHSTSDSTNHRKSTTSRLKTVHRTESYWKPDEPIHEKYGKATFLKIRKFLSSLIQLVSDLISVFRVDFNHIFVSLIDLIIKAITMFT